VAVPTQRAALAIARERGYPRDAVRQAFNRCWRFWVIGQWITVGHALRCAGAQPGTTVVLTLRPPLTPGPHSAPPPPPG
jgi:hypothetical protein